MIMIKTKYKSLKKYFVILPCLIVLLGLLYIPIPDNLKEKVNTTSPEKPSRVIDEPIVKDENQSKPTFQKTKNKPTTTKNANTLKASPIDPSKTIEALTRDSIAPDDNRYTIQQDKQFINEIQFEIDSLKKENDELVAESAKLRIQLSTLPKDDPEYGRISSLIDELDKKYENNLLTISNYNANIDRLQRDRVLIVGF